MDVWEVLLLVIALYLAFMAGMATMTWLMLRQLRRRNRVAPTVASEAPVSWLVSPMTPARLHRRLQIAVRATQLARTPSVGQAHPTLPEMAVTIEQEAVLADRHLVHAARTPRRHRRQMLRPLQAQVREIERLATEVAASARRSGAQALPPPTPATLHDVAAQLQMLRDAEAEIERVEMIERGELPPDLQPGPVSAELPRPTAP
jgi:hypothetical protein